jgi:four helix bundle protein
MGKLLHFGQLEVWQEAHKLVLDVYQLTQGFPGDERFGLTTQMRRAAVSVPANIAEGFKRGGIQEKVRFYNISEGSLEELKYFLILSKDLGLHILQGGSDVSIGNSGPSASRPDHEHRTPPVTALTPYFLLPTP